MAVAKRPSLLQAPRRSKTPVVPSLWVARCSFTFSSTFFASPSSSRSFLLSSMPCCQATNAPCKAPVTESAHIRETTLTMVIFRVCSAASSRLCASRKFSAVMPSRLESSRSCSHSSKHWRSMTEVISLAWRMSVARTLASWRSFSLKSRSSAALSSSSCFCLRSLSALAFSRAPRQTAKDACMTASSCPAARPMRQALAFSFLILPKPEIWVSQASHICLAYSASSAAFESLTILSSVLCLQLPCVSMVLATSLDATTTALRRTFRETPMSSSTSRNPLTPSSSPASNARLASEIWLSAFVSCCEILSKFACTFGGMLLTMQSTTASSSDERHLSLSPFSKSTPLISRRSRAARKAFLWSQLFAAQECTAL
mmetsp:Transcript_97534/g.259077  ORF Transcript_97534/g.259077 Transcript_97534/m.259077 type:complete len:372 (+) Transcript_97534:617-1732(+)